jgi:hypothetical protein
VTVTVRSLTRGRLDEFGVLVYPEPAEPERRELLDSHYISMPVQQLRAWGVDVPRPVTRQGQPVLVLLVREDDIRSSEEAASQEAQSRTDWFVERGYTVERA